jgi:NTP pyrophosphatase (non-canonical NTP hydrolase)
MSQTDNFDEDRLNTAAAGLNTLSEIIHGRNVTAGWWTDLKTGESLRGYKGDSKKFSEAKRDVLNLLMLVVTEIAEAAEGVRKNCPDDKLPHRSMFEVELADAFIRIFDLAGAHDLDLTGALLEKLAFNANRADHKVENRKKDGGKAM